MLQPLTNCFGFAFAHGWELPLLEAAVAPVPLRNAVSYLRRAGRRFLLENVQGAAGQRLARAMRLRTAAYWASEGRRLREQTEPALDCSMNCFTAISLGPVNKCPSRISGQSTR